MAFPLTSVLDDFNRADGGLGANWTADTLGFGNAAPVIISNQVGTASGDGSAYWNASTPGPDCEVYATVPVRPANGGFVSLFYRIQSPATASVDGYELQVYRDDAVTDYWFLFSLTNQAYSQVGATVNQEWAAGDGIGVAAIGANHLIYHKPAGGSWTHIATRSDSTYLSTGRIGMYVNGSTPRLDDFGGGTISVPGVGSRTLLGVGV